jgi:hypothetical protein
VSIASKGHRVSVSGLESILTGISISVEAWEALSKTLKAIDLAALSFPSDGLSWKLDGN